MKHKKNILKFFGGMMLVGTAAAAPVSATTSQQTNVTVNHAEMLSLTLSSEKISFGEEAKDFTSNTIEVIGATNNPNGYSILFNVNNDYNDLKTSSAQNPYVIPSITETLAPSAFPTLGWGYSLDTEQYNQLPLLATKIFETSSEGQGQHDFTTGIRVAETVPNGSYKNELLFTIVSNGANILTMQDFTDDMLPEIGDSTILMDSRDGNMYTVTRMPDGRVWMTEDIRIAGVTLTPDDSDVLSDFVLAPSDLNSFNETDKEDSVYVDPVNGGYYTWMTATAGATDDDMEIGMYHGEEISNILHAPESICPKGWKLPEVFDYSDLAEQYNYQAEPLMNPPFNMQFKGNVYNSDGIVFTEWYGEMWSSSKAMSTPDYWSPMVFMIYDDDGTREIIELNMSTENGMYGSQVRCMKR